MTPPNAQLQVDPETSAGTLPSSVFGAAGIHGPATVGMHGIGVSTPSAAEVADATVGLDRLLHMANGGMLVAGAMSEITPAGRPSTITFEDADGMKVAGAAPNEQLSIAPMTTN